jgi:hypothetical protein
MGSVISPAEWRAKPGSVGKPFPGLDIRIIDDAGAEVAAGDDGAIYLGPAPGFAPSYRNAPEKTREAYRGELFTVGDVGWKDEDKVGLIAAVTDDLVKKGLHAGKLVGQVAKVVGGGGKVSPSAWAVDSAGTREFVLTPEAGHFLTGVSTEAVSLLDQVRGPRFQGPCTLSIADVVKDGGLLDLLDLVWRKAHLPGHQG